MIILIKWESINPWNVVMGVHTCMYKYSRNIKGVEPKKLGDFLIWFKDNIKLRV